MIAWMDLGRLRGEVGNNREGSQMTGRMRRRLRSLGQNLWMQLGPGGYLWMRT